jgi:DNA-binding transcriptional LysR family regulator
LASITSAGPLGRLEPLALPFQSHKLAFTPALVSKLYGGRTTDAMFESDGRYLHSEGDAGWWAPSGRSFYSPDPADSPAQEFAHARRHFFGHVQGYAEGVGTSRAQLGHGVLSALLVPGADTDAPAQRTQPGRDLIPDSPVRASDQRDRLLAHDSEHACAGAGHQHRLGSAAIPQRYRSGVCRHWPGLMEIRELRYFVAVAEELHFGRAAQRLGIAQPPLSRTIIQLERRLGIALLERNSRKVTLTEAGGVLLAEGRAILSAVTAAERRTQRAAAGHPGLVLAVKSGTAGELLTKLLDAYAAEPGAATVELLLCEAHQHQQLLQDGQADVALLHLPLRLSGRARHRTPVHRGTGRGPAGRTPARRPLPGPDGRRHHAARAPDGPLARSRRQLPRRAGRRGTEPDTALPADRARPYHCGHSRVSRRRPAPGPRRRAGPGRSARDNGDRLAAAQPPSCGCRPDPRCDMSVNSDVEGGHPTSRLHQ